NRETREDEEESGVEAHKVLQVDDRKDVVISNACGHPPFERHGRRGFARRRGTRRTWDLAAAERRCALVPDCAHVRRRQPLTAATGVTQVAIPPPVLESWDPGARSRCGCPFRAAVNRGYGGPWRAHNAHGLLLSMGRNDAVRSGAARGRRG